MPEVNHPRRLLLLMGFYLALLLLPVGFVPLMETTEGRYAEIAREMVTSGNFLEPHFNNIKHFHKPPMAYWLIAAGIRFFGVNDFGVRFFGVIAGCLAVFYLYRLAKIVLDDAQKALYASFIFASSGLFLAVSRIVSTDIYLTCFTVISQYYLFRRILGDRRTRITLLYALFLGLGFLTKGPIVFLFTLLPFFVAKLVDKDHREVFVWREVVSALVVFAAVALPWYIVVISRNPDLLHYFLKVQTVDRLATNHFHRYEPPWYFLYILSVGFFPYVFFFLRGLFTLKALPRRPQILLVYLFVPLLVFSLAQSKQATYILPLFGVGSVFTAEVFASLSMRKIRGLTFGLLAALVPALGMAGFVFPPAHDARFWLFASSVLAAVAVVQIFRNLTNDRFLYWSAGTFLLICSVGLGTAAIAGPELRSYEKMVERINALDPDRNTEVIVYKGFLPSVSFYRGKLAVMALGEEREIQFEENESYRQQYLATEGELADFLSTRKQVFVVAKPERFENFLHNYPFKCDTIFVQRKHSVYFCKKN